MWVVLCVIIKSDCFLVRMGYLHTLFILGENEKVRRLQRCDKGASYFSKVSKFKPQV